MIVLRLMGSILIQLILCLNVIPCMACSCHKEL